MMTHNEMRRWLHAIIQLLEMSFSHVKDFTEMPNPVILDLNLQITGSRQCGILWRGRILITSFVLTDDRGNEYQLITRGVHNYSSRSRNMIRTNKDNQTHHIRKRESCQAIRMFISKISLTLQPNQRFKL